MVFVGDQKQFVTYLLLESDIEDYSTAFPVRRVCRYHRVIRICQSKTDRQHKKVQKKKTTINRPPHLQLKIE